LHTNGSGDGTAAAKIQELREKHRKYVQLGTTLKHERDAILRTKESRPPQISESDEKTGVLLGLECVMAFMVAFRGQTEWRHLEKKGVDAGAWHSTLRLLQDMRHLLKKNRALWAIYHQLQALCMEEVVQCYWYMDATANGQNLLKAERERHSMWQQAHETRQGVEARDMRATVGPWDAVDSAVTEVLRVLSRFADQENLRWRPKLRVPAESSAAANED
jgi:hypothetical protein